MVMLSAAQIKYLLAICNDNHLAVGISEIASNLGVSKASAHKMEDLLFSWPIRWEEQSCIPMRYQHP